MKNRYENRTIRIFISSTFEDMKAERDYLITKVFPILAAKAAERDVTLIPLDLRWGISEEESRSGKVVEICLKEIEQSRPFFIGILGNRYGWCPPVEELEKNTLLKERYGWIEDDIAHGLSVTEMEIQYGVLRNPDKINAYFYIRKKNDGNLDEKPGKTEYWQKTDNASEGNAKLDKLKKLKDSVRNNGRYPVTDYGSVEELGKKVEEAFNILLDSIYPDRRLSNLERERLSQSAFLHSRCDVYIPQSEALMRLTRFMQNTNERYLVVAGKSGIGKSSLIANWLLSAITAGTDKPVTACPPQDWSCNYKIIYHFLGNGNAESDFHIIADRLCNEIRDIYGIKENESDKPNETAGLEQQQVRSSSVYMKELESLFSKISGKERLLIVLDGINQLSGDGISENAKLLLWLPPAPANVKYLFTTLPDDCTMDVFKRRGYPVTELSPMKKGEREELIVRYLKRYGKKLTTEQVNRILSAEQCENTHVLRTLLDELVNFGSYELLDKRIDHYLESGSPEIFFLKVIRRFEEDYGKEFTERILSLIAFSRSGLSEQEILSISGIATYRWSQFYCAFRFHLIVKSGLLTFSQKYMQDAVVSAYKGNGTKSRRDIIRFFLNSESVRAYDELPYQMYILNDAEALYNMLLKPAVIDNIFKKDKHELGRYWRYLIETDDRRFPPEAYLHMHTDEAATVGCFMEMAYIFSKEIIKIRLAKRFIEKIMSIYKNSGGNDSDTLAIFYRFAGDVYSAEGDYIKALKCQNMVLDIKKSIYGEDSIGTANAYNNVGHIYFLLEKQKEAQQYYRKALDIFSADPDNNSEGLSTCYNNLGTSYSSMKQYPAAEDYLRKALQLSLSVYGEKDTDTAMQYCSLAKLLNEQGHHTEAVANYGKALEIYTELVGELHPLVAKCHTGIGCAYDDSGLFGQGYEYHTKALDILHGIFGEFHPDIALVCNNLGGHCQMTGKYDKALEYYDKALEIIRKVYNEDNPLAGLYCQNIGMTYYELKEYDLSYEYECKALDIYGKFFNETYLGNGQCYNNLGAICNATGKYDKAAAYYEKALEIYRQMLGENHAETAKCYNNIGYNMYMLQQYDEAVGYYDKALDIYNGLESTGSDVATCCNNLGLVCFSLKDYESALKCFHNAISIQKAVGNEKHHVTAGCHYNIGHIYMIEGNTEEADRHFEKAQEINCSVFGPVHETVATFDRYISQLHEMYGKNNKG